MGVNQDSHFMLIPSRDISKEVDERPVEIDIVTFKSILIQALDSLHGKVAEILASFLWWLLWIRYIFVSCCWNLASTTKSIYAYFLCDVHGFCQQKYACTLFM